MTFLIARPKDKAEQTLAEFKNNGLKGLVLPVIDITLSQDISYQTRLNKANPSCIIITSSYAAQWLVHAIKANLMLLDVSSIKVICVGKSTAQIIAPFVTAKNVSIATPENSEGILRLEYLQIIADKKIVLLKGKGGRGLISKILQKRKANLTILNVYERIANISLLNAFAFEQSEIRCIIATSIEITELLLSTIDRTWLQSRQWIVASERIRDYAYTNGIEHITVSQGAGNNALLDSANQLVNTGVFND